MESSRQLETLLRKKWLSSNTVRDGIVARFTLTLLQFAQVPSAPDPIAPSPPPDPQPEGERIVYQRVLKAAQDAFRNMKIDDEYPSKEQLLQWTARMEESLGLIDVKERHPGLLAEHRRTVQSLLDKLESA